MQEIYEKTSLTPMRVARLGGYIDWASQPSMFKHYPDFLFRYKFGSNSAAKVVELSRRVTSNKLLGAKPYYQLNTPSAGNLHPIELYVQIRGVKGILSGIYHVDALNDSLVLIREIEEDGLEPIFGIQDSFSGMIFVLSCVPFRSEWKYGERAIRYCYLDAGHQIGAIEAAASASGQSVTILSEYDAECLNTQMGFKDEEFSLAVVAIASCKNKKVEKMKTSLMYVSPTDYSETNAYVAGVIKGESSYKKLIETNSFELKEDTILQRRSARKFIKDALCKDAFEHFMQLLAKQKHPLSLHLVVLEENFVDAGLYKSGEIVKKGHFGETMAKLLIDQSFVKNASMILVITSEKFGSNELMNAAVFAHQIHLQAQMKSTGFSGIGAFYDEKLKGFLQTDEQILYVCAIGQESR